MAATENVSDEVAVDVGEDRSVVGVEFLVAPSALEQPVREELFERFAAVREVLAELHAAVA